MSSKISRLVIPDILDELSEDMRRELIDKQYICVSNFDELNKLKDEIKRLKSDLKFANKCINTLNLFKKFLNGIRNQFESLLDPKQTLELNSLEIKYNLMIEKIRERNPNIEKEDISSGQLVDNSEHNYYKEEPIADTNELNDISDFDDGLDRNSDEDYVQNDENSYGKPVELKTTFEDYEEQYSKIDGPPFKCPVNGCKKIYNLRVHLNRHIMYGKEHLKMKFDPKLRIQCDFCSFRCDSQKWMQKHIKVHKDINCQYCGKNYFSQTGLLNHIRSVHDEKTPKLIIKCTASRCTEVFNNFSARDKHINTIHDEHKYPCNMCEFIGNNGLHLLRHKYTHKTSFVCPRLRCNRRFYNRSALESHLKDHKKAIPVNDLSNEFVDISDIDDGFDMNSDQEFAQNDNNSNKREFEIQKTIGGYDEPKIAGPPFKCPVIGCRKSYDTRRQINQHLVYSRDHLRLKFDPKLRIQCNSCSFRCDSQEWFEKHMKVHNDIICQYCAKNYFSKTGLLNHMRKVHNEKAPKMIIKCTVRGCEEVFDKFSERDKHITGFHKRRYLCNICNFVGNNQLDLLKHKYTHKASFACNKPQCSRRFYNQLALESHLERHKKDISENFESNNQMKTDTISETNESNDVNQEVFNEIEVIESKTDEMTKKPKRYTRPPVQKYTVKCSVVGCKKTFQNRRCLIRHLIYGKQHLNLVFDPNLRYQCDFCSFRCDSQKWYKKHQSVHNDFNCQYCGKNYFSRTGLLNHIKAIHPMVSENDAIKCTADGCDLEFPSTFSRSVHMKRVHKVKAYSCDYPNCDFEAQYPAELEDHIYWHTGEKIYNCDVPGCEFVGENRKKLYWHKYDKHDAGPTPIKCQHCEFTCKNNSQLKKHLLTHTDYRPFKCTVCPKTFKSANNLNTHMKRHSSGPFICNYTECNLEFVSLNQRETHIKVVHQRCHPCCWPGCDYVAPDKSKLTRHKNLHTGESPFKCDWPECGFTARSNYNLIHHKYRHTGERPYSCNWPNCGKSFRTSPAFETHMRMHKRDLCYKCVWPGCEFATYDRSHLRNHNFRHRRDASEKNGNNGNNSSEISPNTKPKRNIRKPKKYEMYSESEYSD